MNSQDNGAGSRCLEVSSVVCEKGFNRLFEPVSFTASEGSAVQISGANGSGKTTLLRAIAGLHQPEQGRINWLGTPIESEENSYVSEMGYLGHKSGLNAELTALENLLFQQSLRSTAKAAESVFQKNAMITSSNGLSAAQSLEQVEAIHYSHLPTHLLSAGQKQRVSLARLLMNNLGIWLLDEPATSLDHRGIKMLEQIISQHTAKGGILIFTSHQELQLSHCIRSTIQLDRVG